MPFEIAYSEEKNEILRQTRGICFDDVKAALKKGGYLDVVEHHNKKAYPNQQILIIKIKGYVYTVPFVFNQKKTIAFLKTVYPDRKLTKLYK